MTQKIEISHRTIIFTVLFIALLWLVSQIFQILVIVFMGMILMSALNPIVEKLEKLKIPRLLAAILIYFTVLLFIILVLAGVIPPLVNQTNTLVTRLPGYIEDLNLWWINEDIINTQINQLIGRLGSISLDMVRLTISLFSNFIVVFTVIFISFYLLLERKNLDDYLLKFFGSKDGKAAHVISKLEKRLGEWVRAQITLMVIVGLMSYIGLRLLGIDFALPLALLAGLLEIVPNIGPTLSAVPAIFAGLAVSPVMALAVVALYFLVQQLENQLIVPQVMKKEAGLNPLVTILALITGFKLGGAAGAVLSIPLVILGETLIKEFFTSKKA